MEFKLPKNTDKFSWTNHSARKMLQYQLSEARVKRVINNPKRKELGIAPGTIAVMQPNSSKHGYEVWVMYQEINSKSQIRDPNLPIGMAIPNKKRIISTWRYPGISPIRTVPEIPPEVWDILDGRDDIK